MRNVELLKQIDAFGLKPEEVRELVNALIERERKRARTDAYTYADLLAATLQVAQFENSTIVNLVLEAKRLIAEEPQ